MPVVVHYCAIDDDELREYCLHAFESFVRRCPKEISPHVPMVIKRNIFILNKCNTRDEIYIIIAMRIK